MMVPFRRYYQLVPDNAGKGYIRTAISGYENTTVRTDNKYYGSGF